MRQVFLDTETTGLAAEAGDRVIEIGCIEMVGRRCTGRTLHHYINPLRPSHPDALKVHGITEAFLADKPQFAAVAQAIVDFVQGADVVIHNAAFDVGFLDAEFKRLGMPPIATQAGTVTDSLLMARSLFPGKSNSLDALCKRLEVDNSNRELHGALLDAGLLAEVYVRMTRGQDALVAEMHDQSGAAIKVAAVDLSSFVLPVPEPSSIEAQAHAALLADLDKACGGKAVWLAMAMA